MPSRQNTNITAVYQIDPQSMHYCYTNVRSLTFENKFWTSLSRTLLRSSRSGFMLYGGVAKLYKRALTKINIGNNNKLITCTRGVEDKTTYRKNI